MHTHSQRLLLESAALTSLHGNPAGEPAARINACHHELTAPSKHAAVCLVFINVRKRHFDFRLSDLSATAGIFVHETYENNQPYALNRKSRVDARPLRKHEQ